MFHYFYHQFLFPVSSEQLLDSGVLLLVDRDRPFYASVDLCGCYHLFMNQDPDVVHTSSDCENNLDHRSISFFVVTVNICSRYRFSWFGIVTLSVQVWLVKSASTIDLLMFSSPLLDISSL